METFSPRTVFDIFDFEVFWVWPWPLTPKSHLASKNDSPFERPYIYDFLFDFYGHRLSISYRFRDIRLQSFKGLTLTFDPWRSSGVKNIFSFERPFTTTYLTSMDTISLSRTVSEILDFEVFRVWPWPLTPEGHLGSKKFVPLESPYRTSYLTSMDTISLSRTVSDIFKFKVFRVWPWPLTPKGHLGSKNFIPLESPYMTSYLTSMDIISLSGTVSEIFDFKIFRVWPWPLNPEGHLGSKKFIPLKSPYMTSYLTSMDTISLSRTVSEIFDFKIFRVWPWPLTPEGHLGSKNFIPLESPYMTSYLTSMDTISLSRTVSEILDFEVLGFDLDLWPLKVIWGQKNLYHWKAHIWLPIWLLWTPSLYLAPFPIYPSSKFFGFDLDLWPLKVIWGQKISYHWKAHIWLPIWLLWTSSLYLVPFSR